MINYIFNFKIFSFKYFVRLLVSLIIDKILCYENFVYFFFYSIVVDCEVYRNQKVYGGEEIVEILIDCVDLRYIM